MSDRPMDRLFDCVTTLARQVQAQQYWMGQAYFLISNGRPGIMAEMIDDKLRSLLNEAPAGPPHMTPEELDATMLEELPAVLQAGHELAHLLRETQLQLDEKRRATSGASPASS